MIRSRLKDQSGQAIIEYVLMLVVSISLLLLLIYQIFTPFQKFLQAYMGTYVQCLLEYGELPAFSNDNDDGSSECNAKFESFTVGAGRPAKDGANGAGGGPGDGESSGESSSSSGDSGSSGSYAGSSGRGTRSFINRGGSGSPGTESGSEDPKVIEVPITSAKAGSGGYRSRSGGGLSGGSEREPKIIYLNSQLSDSERRKVEQRKKQQARAPVVIGDTTEGRAQKRIDVKTPERVVAAVDEEEEFTVGGFVKFLIIAAIVIALVIFVGGQFLQMSKSFSK